jgi:hypothetical protein
MKNLIGMVDFVLLGWNDIAILRNYANFLKQPLELWMFIPCKLVDGVWVVLEDPNVNNYHYNSVYSQMYCDDKKEYQQAKERCLFEGFESMTINENDIVVHKDSFQIIFFETGEIRFCQRLNVKEISTIEDLVKYNLELTSTVQKQIEL